MSITLVLLMFCNEVCPSTVSSLPARPKRRRDLEQTKNQKKRSHHTALFCIYRFIKNYLFLKRKTTELKRCTTSIKTTSAPITASPMNRGKLSCCTTAKSRYSVLIPGEEGANPTHGITTPLQPSTSSTAASPATSTWIILI